MLKLHLQGFLYKICQGGQGVKREFKRHTRLSIMYVLAHQFFGANAPLIEILTEYDKVTNSLNKIIIEFLTLRISFKNRKLCFTRKSQLLIGLFISYGGN